MAKLQMIVTAVFLISVILVDFGAQARHCSPPCASDERCVATHGSDSQGHHNTCIARRCLLRSRRGRCFNFTKFHFDRASMTCHRVRVGRCYGGGNIFSSRENCELSCFGIYRR
ncbi:uncharacterized protein [Littorina saxatilis]|uniref:BPTI/Kunitz inhibitor domain-containing protein n=1 Tax=Littorina saxatilis TaxID=31220 RepID=A0AAN9ATK9_9CAEN